MGVVYSAVHEATGRSVALKVLPRSISVEDKALKRFMREADLASKIDHPNVVKIFEAGRDGEAFGIDSLLRAQTGTGLA